MGFIFDASRQTPEPQRDDDKSSTDQPSAVNPPLGNGPSTGQPEQVPPATPWAEPPAKAKPEPRPAVEDSVFQETSIEPASVAKEPDSAESLVSNNDVAVGDDEADEHLHGPGAIVRTRHAPLAEPIPGMDHSLVTALRPTSVLTEEYRSLRTRLLANWGNRRHVDLVVTSAIPREGKTVTTLNLGIVFSEIENARVLVLECDLRMPSFHRLLNVKHDKGLMQVLKGELQPEEVLQNAIRPSFFYMPSGGHTSDESLRMLSGRRMENLMQWARNEFDYVLLDSPPILSVADAGVLGAKASSVLLVVRMHATPSHAVERGIASMTGYNAAPTGVFLTGSQASDMRYGYSGRYGGRYGYGYGHGYGYGSAYGGGAGDRDDS